MRGSLIPEAKRLANLTPPLDPDDMTEANANNYMFLFDNLATGEYMEDGAILARSLSNLLAREQAVPNLTVEVKAGVGWFSVNNYVTFAGGNSPSFTAPAANPRIDILVLRTGGTLVRLAGTEAASPVAPTIASTDIAIAQIYNVVGQTTIRDNDEQVAGQGYIQYDLRPLFSAPVGASAMPKIGLVARATLTSASSSYVTVLDYTGAGRFLGMGFIGTNVVGVAIRVTIDGVAYTTQTLASDGTQGKLFLATTSTTTMFDISNDEASYNEFGAGINFKTSLKVEIFPGGSSMTGTVAYEHE